MITVKRKVQFARDAKGKKRLVTRRRPAEDVGPCRVPRIARLMALAIRFDRLIREGTVADRSELARLACVTQPRMTQIMNLLNLAPDIQDDILHLPSADHGRDSVTERHLRPITGVSSWAHQQSSWAGLHARMADRCAGSRRD